MVRAGLVENKQVNTYTVKKDDGSKMVEQVNIDKDKNAVDHKVNGKDVDNKIHYEKGNGEMMMIVLLNDIKRQLVEMNYYMAKLADERKE